MIGTGRMGRRHIQALQHLELDLRAVFDVNADALRLAHAENGVPEDRLFTDLEQLYASARPECVVIATTADSHCELACMAAERGARYVLLEKPMAVSLAECDRIIETCAAHGVGLAVNHQVRFMDVYAEPRHLAATEEFGGLESMTVVGGNFGFAMLGTHYFEAFRLAAGEPVAEVTAWFSDEIVPNPRGARFQDRAGCIRATTAGGTRLYIDASADQGHGIRVTYACRNGMITVDALTGEMWSSAREAQHRDLATTRYGMPATVRRWQARPAEVVESTATVLRELFAKGDVVTGEDGRAAIEALVAAYQSAEHGNAPVAVGANLDRARTFPWA